MFQFAHKAIQPFLLLKQQRCMHICATIRVYKLLKNSFKFFVYIKIVQETEIQILFGMNMIELD